MIKKAKSDQLDNIEDFKLRNTQMVKSIMKQIHRMHSTPPQIQATQIKNI
jgi:hypothetical protein